MDPELLNEIRTEAYRLSLLREPAAAHHAAADWYTALYRIPRASGSPPIPDELIRKEAYLVWLKRREREMQEDWQFAELIVRERHRQENLRLAG